MSEQEQPQIYAKICEALKKIEAIDKGGKNQQQGFKFRGIDQIMNALHGIFKEVGLFLGQEVLEDKVENRESKSGSQLIYRILRIRYCLYCEDGSSVCSTVTGEGMDTGDKAANKAMAVALKYFLTQMFLIPYEGMEDPDSESHEMLPKPKPKATPPPKAEKPAQAASEPIPATQEKEAPPAPPKPEKAAPPKPATAPPPAASAPPKPAQRQQQHSVRPRRLTRMVKQRVILKIRSSRMR